jgi:alpha-1,2-mannosyltransferase
VTTSFSPTRLGRAALPIVGVLTFVAVVGAILAVAGDTLGFDFLAYHQAAVRLLNGQPLYDTSFEATGGFGLFYYPPTFAPLILPFGLLSATTAVWTWTAILIGSFGVGTAILPVTRTVRWWIVLLAGLSWPFTYAVKLGQVGPILFLLFAVGWRWLDDPVRLGASAALGTAIKLQPAIIFVWAALTRRWAALAVGAVVLGVLAVAATLLASTSAWSDFFTLVRQVGDPITTPHNFTPGAIAYQLGVNAQIASYIQVASTVVVLGAVVAAARWATAEASYLVAVIASQLLSPILWDHYAMLLLLPVAYLCAAGRWWALLIPLVTAVPLIGVTPPIAYPLCFAVALGATLGVGIQARGAATAQAA